MTQARGRAEKERGRHRRTGERPDCSPATRRAVVAPLSSGVRSAIMALNCGTRSPRAVQECLEASGGFSVPWGNGTAKEERDVGLFTRIWRIIKGWLLIGVEKAEDPEVILTEAKEAME